MHTYYQNVRGLRTKTNDFYKNTSFSNYDLICLTETFLNNSINNSELFNCDFNVFRRDRDASNSLKSGGGGVLIATRSCIAAVHLSDWQTSAEDLWISVTGSDNRVCYVCCVYLPDYNSVAFQEFFENVHAKLCSHPDDFFVILGDFNLPQLSWSQKDNYFIPFKLANEYRHDVFIDYSNLCSLFQFNYLKNVSNNVLDLLLTNFNIVNNLNRCDTPLISEDTYHPSFEFIINLKIAYLKYNTIYSYLYNRMDTTAIANALCQVEWGTVLARLDTNQSVSLLYETLYDLIHKHVPRRKINKNKFPRWFSASTIKCIREKNKFHKRWKKTKNKCNYVSFKILRGRSKFLIAQDYSKYIANVEQNVTDNHNSLWNFISAKSKKSGIPNILTHDDCVANDPVSICSVFSNYFHSVYEPADPIIIDDNDLNESCANLGCIKFSDSEIRNALLSLDTKKGHGPDNIPPLFFKNLADKLTSPLHIIFNKSISENTFPDSWKKALVVPIFKSGDKSLVKNYRPISKLNVMSKLFEKLVFSHLSQSVSNLIIPQQHGFFAGRSVETNLLTYADYLSHNMNQQIQVDSIGTDLRKAFDKINHSILINKLIKIGIHGDLLRWLISYISNRTQAVNINGFTSDFVILTSGLPQGSHLGPLLFLLFINDIAAIFKFACFLLFADDLRIYKRIQSRSDAIFLQQDLFNFATYCQKNKLFINCDKCHVITFSRNKNIFNFNYSINNTVLSRVTEIKDLGVIFDSKLTFEPHINYICAKALKMLGFIIRTTKDFRSAYTVKVLYYAFVFSNLNYCSIIWNPLYNKYISKLEHIQKRALKYICFKNHNRLTDYNETLLELDMLSLKDRRVLSDMITLYKILNNMFNSTNLISLFKLCVPSHNIRNHNLFLVNLANNNTYYNSPVERLSRTYNNIFNSVCIFSTNLESFKKHCKLILQHTSLNS